MGKGSMKLLTSVGILVMLALSWYMLFSSKKEEALTYFKYLETAREKRADKLYDEALDQYMLALAEQDTVELRDEIAATYKEQGNFYTYEDFCNELILAYPYESIGYEHLANYYKESDALYACFTTINTAKKRGVSSEVLSKIVEELKYAYEETYISYLETGYFYAGLCPVMKSNGKWGYVNVYGKTAIPCTYSFVGPFSPDGLALITETEGGNFLIDTTGRSKVADPIERKIEFCYPLIYNKMVVKYDGKYHYCDKDFSLLFGGYDYAGSFSSGVAPVLQNGVWSLIDEKGNPVPNTEFEDIKMDDKGIAFRNNVAFAKRNGKYILIDPTGKQVGTGEWDDADAFNSAQPAAVKSGSLWGFVNASGEIVLDYQYENAKSFANDLAAVTQNGRWGYIDVAEYKVQIECKYLDAKDFSEAGSAFVFNGEDWTMIKLYRLNKD